MNCEKCGTSYESKYKGTSKEKKFCSEKCRKSAEKKRARQRLSNQGINPKTRKRIGLKECLICGANFNYAPGAGARKTCNNNACRDELVKRRKEGARSVAREKRKAENLNRQQECQECKSIFRSEVLSKWCSDECRELSVKWKSRLRCYGISRTEYERMHSEQDGKCLICKKDQDLVVDHCHKTGAVRGLLCSKCNCGIGFLMDDIKLLESAVLYLENCHTGK